MDRYLVHIDPHTPDVGKPIKNIKSGIECKG
jgi:hypothetical protein